MNGTWKRRIAAAAAAPLLSGLVLAPTPAEAAVTRVYAQDSVSPVRGWITQSGDHFVGEPNYVVGVVHGVRYRNFFGFFRPAGECTATSAVLRLQAFEDRGDAAARYTLREVRQSPSQLLNTSNNPAGFADLGDGPVLGTTDLSLDYDEDYFRAFVEVPLNAAGLAALNSVANGHFLVGGSLTDLGGIEAPGFQFGLSHTAPARVELVATCDESALTGITGPSTLEEGATATFAGDVDNPRGVPLTRAWSVVEGAARIEGPTTGASVTLRAFDGPSTVRLRHTVQEAGGSLQSRDLLVPVTNVAPVAPAGLVVDGPVGPACIGGSSVRVRASATDAAGGRDPLTGTLTWGDGSAATSLTSGTVDQTHTYAPGTHGLTLRLEDGDGGELVLTRELSYLFRAVGPLEPIAADGSSQFALTPAIPVRVRITDCNATPVPGLTPVLGVDKRSDLADTAPLTPAPILGGGPSVLSATPVTGEYMALVDRAALGPGYWTAYIRGGGTVGPPQLQGSFTVR